ncbi:MAG: hypothetical protein ACLQVM_15415 [Terriglobia bacterium]
MPRIRRHHIPPALFRHLLDRIQRRKIPASQLEFLAPWLDTEPEVPEGDWFKRFSGMTVGGEGEFIKTFPLPGQRPKGDQVE